MLSFPSWTWRAKRSSFDIRSGSLSGEAAVLYLLSDWTLAAIGGKDLKQENIVEVNFVHMYIDILYFFHLAQKYFTYLYSTHKMYYLQLWTGSAWELGGENSAPNNFPLQWTALLWIMNQMATKTYGENNHLKLVWPKPKLIYHNYSILN